MNDFSIPHSVLFDVVQRALREDLGGGDLTSEACVPAAAQGAAQLIARTDLVVCGWPLVQEVFAQVDPNVKAQIALADGTACPASAVLGTLGGNARSLLMGERVALNFLQRLSGIATLTAKFVHAAPAGKKTRITDTRKTTPGLRALERYAVRCGGGFNHREDLSAAILIKDNHIAACGGVEKAIHAARAHAAHTSKIECEVENAAQLKEALAGKADIIMLDNFSDADVQNALQEIAGRALVEVSGSVNVERVARLAEMGVDIISVGALTHSAPAADISLEWQ